jgi:hypothetical protein
VAENRQGKTLTCHCLCVRSGPGTTALDVIGNVMYLFTVLVRDGGARRGPRVRTENNSVLEKGFFDTVVCVCECPMFPELKMHNEQSDN